MHLFNISLNFLTISIIKFTVKLGKNGDGNYEMAAKVLF